MADVELWQAEWCPDSYVIRQRLTELGVDFVARQVPVAREARADLRLATGQEGIPAIIFSDGLVVTGDAADLVAELDRRFPDPPDVTERELAARERGRTPVGREMIRWRESSSFA